MAKLAPTVLCRGLSAVKQSVLELAQTSGMNCAISERRPPYTVREREEGVLWRKVRPAPTIPHFEDAMPLLHRHCDRPPINCCILV